MPHRSPTLLVGVYAFDAESLKKKWSLLHWADREPLPEDAGVVQAWVHFHNGEFKRATEMGLKAGGDGITVANKATCIHANHLQHLGHARPELFLQAAERAEAQQAREPENANAWYWQGYALGRYSQSISVTKALAQGLGSKVKAALEHTITLAPRHAAAHLALAAFHAEVIDKVGTLVGCLAYGAKKDTALMLFRQALQLNPSSAIVKTEYARGLLMLEGDKQLKEAMRLCEQAAACEPWDAMEQLDVQRAKTLVVSMAKREFQA